jgi:hypothetical protein
MILFGLSRLYRAFLVLCVLTAASAVHAQEPQLSPDVIASKIASEHPKTVVFVYDVTMSTLHNGVFGNERAATATILRDGCQPGDHVVMLSFGTGDASVFDETLQTHEDAIALIDKIPTAPSPGRGTNIRLPHYDALKLIEEGLPNPGVIVLLTDSFNDSPAPTDPNLAQYNAYYSPKGLTVYPRTAENRAYEQLLHSLRTSGKLQEYGVGVAIASNYRPIERVPTNAESDDPTNSSQAIMLQPVDKQQERRVGDPSLLLWGCFGMIVLGLLWGAVAISKPTPVRLALGERGAAQDFHLKSGRKVALGGSIADCGPGNFFMQLPGLKGPAAFVAAAGGGVVLVPVTGNPEAAKVYHNGSVLERQAPLRAGDEIRINAPGDDPNLPREYRVRFLDPKAPLF